MPYKDKEKQKEYIRRYHKEYREEIIEKRKGYFKKYWLKNREKGLAYSREYYKNNLEKEKEYQRQYYYENREKILAYNKRYQEEHKEHYKEIISAWSKTEAGKISQKKKDKKYNRTERGKLNRQKAYLKRKEIGGFVGWQGTEKDKARSQRGHMKRRIKEKEIINTLTAQEWADILEVYNYRCAYCDVEFEVENMPHKDHVIPISKGGHNTKENVVPTCQSCNSKKGNKLNYKSEAMVI